MRQMKSISVALSMKMKSSIVQRNFVGFWLICPHDKEIPIYTLKICSKEAKLTFISHSEITWKFSLQNLDKSQPLPPNTSSVSASPKKHSRLNAAGGHEAEKEDGMLDLRKLREKSRNLDLPLISALCNDRNLLKQTNAFVLPKHPSESTSLTFAKSTTRSSNGVTSGRSKYPLSGISNPQVSKPPRKSSSITHKHPDIKGSTFKRSIPPTTSPVKKDATRASHS